MLTDVVREVREAARVREEALLNRVKALVDERSWSLNESNFRFIREIDDLKNQVHHLKSERKETNQKLLQMDAEMKTLKALLTQNLNFSRLLPNLSQQQSSLQNEYITNRQQQNNRINTPKRNSINLSYGTVQHEDGIHLQTVKENEINRNGIGNNNSSVESSENLGSPGRIGNAYQDENNYSSPEQKPLSNKSFGSEEQLKQLEKDNLVLRRELQNARASSHSSEIRIKA